MSITTKSKLVALRSDHTVVDAFKAFQPCCLEEIAKNFFSQPGSQLKCSICDNRMTGVLLRALDAPRDVGFGSLGPHKRSLELEAQGLFFTRKFLAEKVEYVAKSHDLPFDAYSETTYGHFLMLQPGSWYVPGSVVLKKVAEGVVTIFGLRKEEFKSHDRSEAESFGDPIWWG